MPACVDMTYWFWTSPGWYRWVVCWEISWSYGLWLFPLELVIFPRGYTSDHLLGGWGLGACVVCESWVGSREGRGRGPLSRRRFSAFSQVTPFFSEWFPDSPRPGGLGVQRPLALHSLESACGNAGVREGWSPRGVGREGAVSPQLRVLGPSVLVPQVPVQPPILGLFRIRGVLGWFSALPTAGFYIPPKPLTTGPLLSRVRILLLPPLLFSLLLWFIYLKKIILLWF